MTKSICVIGAGASGLTCIKECLAAGFRVVSFEQASYTGGLWRYHEEDLEEVASVTKATIINSSKEVSAFSDFPPEPSMPNYCHHSQLIKYFDSYAEKFHLKDHVKFRHRVVTLTETDDGKWLVKVLNLQTQSESESLFDAVMVATGHHTKPHRPHFEGLQHFKGTVIHTHSYKRPDPFVDKKVLIIGIGNSAGDAAVELSSVAQEVYLSTRSGSWVLSRVYRTGLPMDYLMVRRFINYLAFKVLPYNLTCSAVEFDLNQKFDHKLYGLKPKHRIFGQHPFVNDALPNRILSGTVKIKRNVQQFTENGVIFEGDNGHVTAIDVVILATGYETHFPFLEKGFLDTSNHHINLFKYALSPHAKRPESLMFIGLVQPYGPLIPISELQARWFCQLQLGRVALPPKDKMMLDIEAKRISHHKRYYSSPRHTMQVEVIDFMDETASQFYARPKLLKYLLIDPILWYHLVFGPFVPYQFRLDGPGSWSGARKAIFTVHQRTRQAFATSIDGANDSTQNYFIPLLAVMTMFSLILALFF